MNSGSLARFKRKREEEDLEFARSKVSRLKSQVEGSSVVDKLRQEVREYREILKCSFCLDRRKEALLLFILFFTFSKLVCYWS